MRAQLDTFVEKVHAKEGQQVKKGQLLLEIEREGCVGRNFPRRSRSSCARRRTASSEGGRQNGFRGAGERAIWRKCKRSETVCRRITKRC